MKKVDLSLSNESQEELESNLATLTHTTVDRTTLLFDYDIRFITQVNVPSILFYITTFYTYMQRIVIYLWSPYRKDQTKYNLYFEVVFLFHKTSSLIEERISSFAVSSLGFLSVLWIAGCYIYFLKNKKYSVHTLRIQAFCVYFIMPLTVLPCSRFLGYHLSRCFVDFQVADILIALYSGITFFILFAMIFYFSLRTNINAFISNDPMCLWEPKIRMYSLGISAITCFFGNFGSVFSVFLYYVIILAHLLLGIGELFLIVKKMSYVFIGSSSFAFGFGFCNLIQDLMFFMPNNFFSLIFVPIGIGILVSVIMFFVFNNYRKKVLKSNNKSESKNKKSSDNNNYKDDSENDNNNIDNVSQPEKPEKKLLQLRLAFVYNDPHFIDGSLIEQALALAVHNNSIKLEIARICILFPRFDAIVLSLINELMTVKTFSMNEKFLLYSINFASQARQTLLISDDMNDLKNSTLKLTMQMQMYWIFMCSSKNFLPNEGYELLNRISRMAKDTSNRWKHELKNYPLNAVVAQSYATHLIENECDFEESTSWLYRASQIQIGNLFDFDFGTVSLLRTFPAYADELLSEKKMASFDDLDLRKREESLQPYINDVKLHLEFQRAIQPKTSPYINIIMYQNIIRSAVNIILMVVVMIMLFNQRSGRVVLLKYMESITTIDVSTSLTILTLYLHYADNIIHVLPPRNDFLLKIGANVTEMDGLLNLSKNWLDSCVDFIREGRIGQQVLISTLELSIDEKDTFSSTIQELHQNDLIYPAMVNKVNVANITTDLRQMIVVFFAFARNMTNYVNLDYLNEDKFLEISQMHPIIEGKEKTLTISFKDDLLSYMKVDHKVQILTIIIVAVGFSAIFIPLTINFHILFHKDMKIMLKYCFNLPEDVKMKGTEAVLVNPEKRANESSKGNESKLIGIVKSKERFTFKYFPLLFDMFVNLIFIGFFFSFLYPIIWSLGEFTKISEAIGQAGQRTSSMAQVITHITIGALSTTSEMKAQFTSSLASSLKDLSENHAKLLKFQYDTGNPATSKIRKLMADVKCPTSSEDMSLHTRYSCDSTDQAMITFLEICRHIALNIGVSIFGDNDYYNALHLGSKHLYPPLREVIDLYIEYAQYISDTYNSLFQTFAILSVVVAIIAAIIDVAVANNYRSIFKTGILLLHRIPPLMILADSQMTSYLLGKNAKSKVTTSSIASRILMASSHPIVFVNGSSNTVIGINTMFQTTYGFDPAHIIGFGIDRFLKEKDAIQKINSYFQNPAMKNASVDQNSIILTKCNKETGGIVDVEIRIINITSNEKSGDNEKAFAFVLTDKNEEFKLVARAENIKNSNMTLIKSLFPSCLKASNEFEYQMSSSAVILIKFTDFSLNAAPAEICKYCTDLWSYVDDLLTEHMENSSKNIIKCSINNEVLCAVSSIDKGDDYANVTNAFQFVISVFHKFNDTVVAGSLQVAIEIGHNTKLVLIDDETKKTLVVSGDAFDEAYKLLQVGHQGKIAVSPTTYNILGQLSYPVEEQRNDIVRKYYLFSPEISE